MNKILVLIFQNKYKLIIISNILIARCYNIQQIISIISHYNAAIEENDIANGRNETLAAIQMK